MDLARFNVYNEFPQDSCPIMKPSTVSLNDRFCQVTPWTPAVDILETETELIFKVDVAGVNLKTSMSRSRTEQ